MLTRIFSYLASRSPATSKLKRDLVTTAFWHLQDVAYTRLRDAGFDPSYIIDVGACSGEWSKSVRNIFPRAPILMIEARAEEMANLQKTASEIGNAMYSICLLGASPCDAVPFSLNSTGSSIFPERSNVAKATTSLPMQTLDAFTYVKAPAFLKIDCQGAEIEILKGASEILRACEVVQLEAALLPYNQGAPLAAEVISFMDARGFLLFDIAGFVRPVDKHLVQIDFLFVRKESPLRPSYFNY